MDTPLAGEHEDNWQMASAAASLSVEHGGGA